jgi:Putative metal-binding motif
MDANRFDEMLRVLSTTPTRRNTLRLLSGSALAGLLHFGTITAEAKKGGNGKGKGQGKDKDKKTKIKKVKEGKITICHKGQTITVAASAWKGHEKHGDMMGACSATLLSPPPPQPLSGCTPPCRGDLTCSTGTCRCASGTQCGDRCISLGASCPTGLAGVCAAGTIQCQRSQPACVPTVLPGTQAEICDGLDNDCDGLVDEGFDLQTDANNCGECGTVCAFPHATASCSNGNCTIASCETGFANCSPSIEDGCETELGTIENCSTCGDSCGGKENSTAVCQSGSGPGPGTCFYTCNSGFADCDLDGGCECEVGLTCTPSGGAANSGTTQCSGGGCGCV